MWNVPNALSLSRLPLSAGLFLSISERAWLPGLVCFAIAALTDWLDGWWARRFNQLTAIGRHLDPLTDKVLLNGAFIFLMLVPESGITAWMATVIVTRELLVTGIRGIVEATGLKFAADWFGKLKTVLQFIVLGGILILMTVREHQPQATLLGPLATVYAVLLWLMLAATIGSGLQYGVKAWHLLKPA